MKISLDKYKMDIPKLTKARDGRSWDFETPSGWVGNVYRATPTKWGLEGHLFKTLKHALKFFVHEWNVSLNEVEFEFNELDIDVQRQKRAWYDAYYKAEIQAMQSDIAIPAFNLLLDKLEDGKLDYEIVEGDELGEKTKMARLTAKTKKLMGVKSISNNVELDKTLQSLATDIRKLIDIEEDLSERLQDVWSYMVNSEDADIQSLHEHIKNNHGDKYLDAQMEELLTAVRQLRYELNVRDLKGKTAKMMGVKKYKYTIDYFRGWLMDYLGNCKPDIFDEPNDSYDIDLGDVYQSEYYVKLIAPANCLEKEVDSDVFSWNQFLVHDIEFIAEVIKMKKDSDGMLHVEIAFAEGN